MGIFQAARKLNPSTLTVLNYHRVDDITRPGFDSFAPNVSATPEVFAQQVDYLQKHYHVFTCKQLAAWMRGEGHLPPRAALITFDDGYYDNYANAFPILKARNLPAIIFLTTDHIGEDHPFDWDYIAYCFTHGRKSSARLPLLGYASWGGTIDRRRVVRQWIYQIKLLPDKEKKGAIAELVMVLDVSVPEGAFSNLYLTWDQVREMVRDGIEIGSHTARHPILTRIPLSQVETELVRSKQKIEAEIEPPVIGFAYPNGSRSDFSPAMMGLVQRAAYELAFSLVGGVTSYTDIREQPFAIHRTFLGSSDTFPRFTAKLGLGRFAQH